MKKELRKQMMMFLLLAGISFHLFPELLLTVVFYIKGSSLAEWVSPVCKAAGVVLGMVFMLFAMKAAFSVSGEKNKGFFPRYLVGMVNAVFAYLLYESALEWLEALLMKVFMWQYAVGLILLILISLFFIALQGTAMYWWACGVMPGAKTLPGAAEFKKMWTSPVLCLEVTGLVLVIDFVPALISLALAQLPSSMGTNISINLMIYLLIAVLEAGGLSLIFLLIRKQYQGKQPVASLSASPKAETAEEMVSEGDEACGTMQVSGTENKPKRARRFPVVAVSAIGIVVILVIRGVSVYGGSPIDPITEEIEEMVARGSVKLIQGDIDGGVQDMKSAVLVREVWASMLGMEDAESLHNLYNQNPSNTMVNYFYLTAEKNVEGLEKYLRVNETDPEFCLALLDLYAEQKNLSDYQKILANELKYVCASSGTYTRTMLQFSDLAGYEERLEKKLRSYSELKEQVELLEICAQIVRNGSATKQSVGEALSYAEKHPDSWIAQYQAAITGSSLTYDGAGHYDRTIQAAIRFEELYCRENELDEERLCNVRLKTAEMIITCYGYQQALPYLEEVIEMGRVEDAFSMAAQCYEALGRHEECYELCVKMLESDPDHLSARYYAAIDALKSGMQTEALEHTSELADLAKNTVTKENYGADVALYTLLQFIAINDSGTWTEYNYSFYNKMTDEQKAFVKENPFFADYLTAVYECFSGHNGADSRTLAKEAVDRVLAENSELPQAWYLKGAIHYECEEFEEAVASYQKSLAIVPDSATVWFALANAYDGMAEYDLAYEACERTMALLPEQDHGSDWYGVSVHCQNLMNALKSKVTGGR